MFIHHSNQQKEEKKWIVIFITSFVFLAVVIMCMVIIIDPFFHYHAPLKQLYYPLDNERSQNDGMLKHFDYDALIVGNSLTENFKTSELDALFNVNALKSTSCGASYKEVDNYIKTAFRNNKNLKVVVRCLDYSSLIENKDFMRTDMGEYPEYLYNKNIFDDVKYIYNWDVFVRCLYILKFSYFDKKSGVMSFDEYANWSSEFEGKFGRNNERMLKNHASFLPPSSEYALSDTERETIISNISQNVVETANANPKTQFYIYLSPYSAIWWGDIKQEGNLKKYIESEKIAIEMMLQCPNIHLYSFNNFYYITTNLDNYRDRFHYGEWINSDILVFMKEGKGLITKDNYLDYLQNEEDFYDNFDYNSL